MGSFPPLVQNGSYNVWGTTFSGVGVVLTGLYYDPWPLDWTASILGQLDQTVLFNQLNFYVSSGWLGPLSTGWDPQNTSVLATQVAILICPSEDKKTPSIGPGTRRNYVANVGGPANFMAWSGVLVPLRDNPPLNYAGVYWNSNSGNTFGIESITDGSYEHGDLQRNPHGFRSARLRSLCPRRLGRAHTNGWCHTITFGTKVHPADSTAQLFVQACRALPGIQLSVGTLLPPNGDIWLAGNPGSSLMWDAYNHYMPPNSTGCAALNDPNINPGGNLGGTNLGTTYGGWGSFMDAIPPSSNHPNGVNVAFADGGVRFIKNQIALNPWWAIGTRNGSEALSSDAY